MPKIELKDNFSADYGTFLEKYKAVCKQLRSNRMDSGVNIDMVAEWLNVGRKQVMAIESGERIDIELLYKYCHIYGIKLNFDFEIT